MARCYDTYRFFCRHFWPDDLRLSEVREDVASIIRDLGGIQR